MRLTIGALLLWALASLGCVNDIAEIDALFAETDTKVEVGNDIEILYSDSAYVRIRLLSPTLHRHLNRAEPKDEFPDGLHVDFLNRAQDVESTLDADHGIRYPRKSIIVVSENVVLINQRGEKLETSELTWDEKKQQVSTDRFVKFTKPEEVIYAYGFRANQDFTEYQLYSVVARVKVNDLNETSP
ncbi:MAG: LPS export ABC transporter periplasmic protein LptC [Saprospiraceae bacterium]|nr:LPS export ABC transporter periplasmic protein LptC [Saprospiraceae bacterium]